MKSIFHFQFNKTALSYMCLPVSRLVDIILKIIMRVMWFAGGFHWITVKGQRALPAEAPILTLAPHSSYFDAMPVTMTMASIVMKAESKDIPVWGSKYIHYWDVGVDTAPSLLTSSGNGFVKGSDKSGDSCLLHEHVQHFGGWTQTLQEKRKVPLGINGANLISECRDAN